MSTKSVRGSCFNLFTTLLVTLEGGHYTQLQQFLSLSALELIHDVHGTAIILAFHRSFWMKAVPSNQQRTFKFITSTHARLDTSCTSKLFRSLEPQVRSPSRYPLEAYHLRHSQIPYNMQFIPSPRMHKQFCRQLPSMTHPP